MIKTIMVLAYFFGGAEPHQVPMTLTSAVIKPNSEIPSAYTCRGHDSTFPLKWEHVPSGTRSLALVMCDKMAPQNRRYLWAIYNISPEQQELPASTLFRNNQLAKNSWGHLNYQIPCSSSSKGHHYVIKLYALKAYFYFHQYVTIDELLAAMQHRTIETATLETNINSSMKFAKIKNHG